MPNLFSSVPARLLVLTALPFPLRLLLLYSTDRSCVTSVVVAFRVIVRPYNINVLGASACCAALSVLLLQDMPLQPRSLHQQIRIAYGFLCCIGRWKHNPRHQLNDVLCAAQFFDTLR